MTSTETSGRKLFINKTKFYNPIRQNYGHIQALKQNLQEFRGINFIPIVVFSVDAKLKVETQNNVIYSINLLKTIKEHTVETITDVQKEAIYSRLLNLNIGEKGIRKQHVDEINKKKIENADLVKSNKCPKCGGNLILRRGQYGNFKGCSNYPKCKFTVNN